MKKTYKNSENLSISPRLTIENTGNAKNKPISPPKPEIAGLKREYKKTNHNQFSLSGQFQPVPLG